ncbi:MAG: Mur ligase family protein, partial [Verrucomicrobiota bacterium]
MNFPEVPDNLTAQPLIELLRGLPVRDLHGNLQCGVTGIAEHSALVSEGGLFVACPGEKTHGRNFVNEAFERGARVVCTETPLDLPAGMTQVRVSGISRVKHQIAQRFYDFPQYDLDLIGIIGSEQRTPVSSIAHFLLDNWFNPTGLINAEVCDFGRTLRAAELTTPEPCDLYRLLREMIAYERRCVVMEITTQGLLRQRVRGLGFHVLAFTDHRFERDAADEWSNVLTLKEQALARGWDHGPSDIVVINRNDPVSSKLLCMVPTAIDTVTYGIDVCANIRAENLLKTPLGWQFDLLWEGGRVQTLFPIKGPKKKVLEALGALAIAHAYG